MDAAAAAAPAGEGAAQGSSRAYEVSTYWAFPLCFVSGNYEATTVHKDNLELRDNLTVCRLGVKNGGGYNFVRLPMDHIARYGIHSEQLLCLQPKGSLYATVHPVMKTFYANIKGPDIQDFLERMWANLPPTLGLKAGAYGEKPVATQAKVTRCGANTRTLTIHNNGLVLMTEIQAGITTLKHVDAALLKDLSYVRYTKAPIFQAICFGKTNRIELVFEGDHYVLDNLATEGELPQLMQDIKFAMLQRAPSKPISVITGATSSVEIGPEFTTVSQEQCGWAGDMCKHYEVTAVKTKDIAYLSASLPSWINALIRAIRDIELAKLAAVCTDLSGKDLVMLPVWPCQFLNDSWIAIVLTVNALISIFQFLVVFFCRKTAVIIGGPGPAKSVVLPVAEKPEELLQSIANNVTIGQASFEWPVPKTIVYSGASKAPSDIVVKA